MYAATGKRKNIYFDAQKYDRRSKNNGGWILEINSEILI
jgi:hypothetical protein